MAGTSYSCPVCLAYLGRGRANREKHRIPEDCVDMVDRSIAVLQDRVKDWQTTKRALEVAEDAGISDPREIFQIVNDARRQSHLRKEATT